MMAAFADAAPAWAAAGIVPLTVSPTGKGWMVKHPETFRRPAAMALAAKRPGLSARGFSLSSRRGRNKRPLVTI